MKLPPLPEKKRTSNIGYLIALLILLLVLGWWLAPFAMLARWHILHRQTARYEAVMDAGIDLLVEIKKRNEIILKFDPHFDRQNESRISTISNAYHPLEISDFQAWYKEDRYGMRIGGPGRCGYEIRGSEDGVFIIIVFTDEGSQRELKRVPFATSKLNTP